MRVGLCQGFALCQCCVWLDSVSICVRVRLRGQQADRRKVPVYSKRFSRLMKRILCKFSLPKFIRLEAIVSILDTPVGIEK